MALIQWNLNYLCLQLLFNHAFIHKNMPQPFPFSKFLFFYIIFHMGVHVLDANSCLFARARLLPQVTTTHTVLSWPLPAMLRWKPASSMGMMAGPFLCLSQRCLWLLDLGRLSGFHLSLMPYGVVLPLVGSVRTDCGNHCLKATTGRCRSLRANLE